MERLAIVAIEIVSGCNLRCSFCTRDACTQSVKSLKIEEFECIIGKIKKMKEPPMVAITGGEPLLNKNINRLISILENNKLKYCITTNGTILDHTLLEFIRNSAYFRHFIVSVDSCNPKIHDKIRGVNGAFHKTYNFIQALKELKIEFCINMTINKDNFRDVLPTIKWAKEEHATDISIASAKPSGRGKADLTMDELQEIADGIINGQQYIDDKFAVYAAEVTFFLYDFENYKESFLNGDLCRCSFGYESLHIDFNGNIKGCATCDCFLDNINNNDFSFDEFWETNDILLKIRDTKNLHAVCKECEYVKFCGGCRCRAYALTGDLFGEDEYCPLVKKAKVSI